MNYVALDVGNVLVHVDFSAFTDELSSLLNISLEEAQYFLSNSCRLHDMGLTTMSDELRDRFKIKSHLTIDRLLSTWSRSIYPNAEMIELFQQMVSTNDLKVALLSNVGLEHCDVMKRILGKLFETSTKHLSCQVGARKPTMLYYQSFLLQHPEFTGCAYLDDLKENLEASEQFGFRPYHFSLEKEAVVVSYPRSVPATKLAQIRDFVLNK